MPRRPDRQDACPTMVVVSRCAPRRYRGIIPLTGGLGSVQLATFSVKNLRLFPGKVRMKDCADIRALGKLAWPGMSCAFTRPSSDNSGRQYQRNCLIAFSPFSISLQRLKPIKQSQSTKTKGMDKQSDEQVKRTAQPAMCRAALIPAME